MNLSWFEIQDGDEPLLSNYFSSLFLSLSLSLFLSLSLMYSTHFLGRRAVVCFNYIGFGKGRKTL
jgi:hypothetical protein